jgi:hypothetical protein
LIVQHEAKLRERCALLASGKAWKMRMRKHGPVYTNWAPSDFTLRVLLQKWLSKIDGGHMDLRGFWSDWDMIRLYNTLVTRVLNETRGTHELFLKTWEIADIQTSDEKGWESDHDDVVLRDDGSFEFKVCADSVFVSLQPQQPLQNVEDAPSSSQSLQVVDDGEGGTNEDWRVTFNSCSSPESESEAGGVGGSLTLEELQKMPDKELDARLWEFDAQHEEDERFKSKIMLQGTKERATADCSGSDLPDDSDAEPSGQRFKRTIEKVMRAHTHTRYLHAVRIPHPRSFCTRTPVRLPLLYNPSSPPSFCKPGGLRRCPR